MKISITNLEAVRQRLTTTLEQGAPRQPTERTHIDLSLGALNWVLTHLGKVQKRLSQSVHDPKARQPKREKKCRELCLVEDIISSLQNSISNHDTEDNQH